MTQPGTPGTDPYAALRRKLRRMAPLVDLDGLLARHDVQALKIWDGGQVRGIAIVLRDAPDLRLQLYFADEARVASALMRLLNDWLVDRTVDTLALAA